jgi:GNAT superfamily N-acetyltransferase
MCDEWMRGLELPLTAEQFRRLPRNGAFRYDYLAGKAYVTPRPKHYHALLDLRPTPAGGPPGVRLRALADDDWDGLVPVFAEAFAYTQPFAGLDEETLRQAAGQCLARTRGGGDGPWIDRASFVADEEGRTLGAVLITLLPAEDPCSWDSYRWREPPPPDCVERRLGRPHLTWVFVPPGSAGQGVGTALLGAAVRALLGLGYTELLSTFMIGNDSSTLWHWRNGFRLLAHPGSRRQGPRSPAGRG